MYGIPTCYAFGVWHFKGADRQIRVFGIMSLNLNLDKTQLLLDSTSIRSYSHNQSEWWGKFSQTAIISALIHDIIRVPDPLFLNDTFNQHWTNRTKCTPSPRRFVSRQGGSVEIRLIDLPPPSQIHQRLRNNQQKTQDWWKGTQARPTEYRRQVGLECLCPSLPPWYVSFHPFLYCRLECQFLPPRYERPSLFLI